MRVQVIDTVGMEEGIRSAFLINLAAPSMTFDDVIEIRGDSPTFENELRWWCEWSRKTLLSVEQDRFVTKVRIQF